MTGTANLILTSLPALLYLSILHVFLCETIKRDIEDTEKEDRTMDTNKDTQCSGYLGVACTDGTCPKACREEYIERDIPVVENCEDCIFHKGREDCYFMGTKFCDKKDTEFKGIIIHENTPDLYEP